MIRLIADDLTGALDAAAPLAAHYGPLTVRWADPGIVAPGASLVFDTGSRELARAQAEARVRDAAARLWQDFDGIAFKKVDSVWRGHASAEIAAACAAVDFDRVIVAPAFPQQGRVTRGGGQWVVDSAGERCVLPDIAADLRDAGLPARREDEAGVDDRVVVCDCAREQDLHGVVARYLREGVRVLWCGTSGLAGALAARAGAATHPDARDHAPREAAGPVVVFVGTDHAVAQAQADALAARAGVVSWRIDAQSREAPSPPTELAAARVVLVRFALPDPISRAAARARIGQALAAARALMPVPRLVVATGGETLRSLSEALGATALEVFAQRMPGVPLSTWVDGAWRAVPLISKSGGFGASTLFCDLLELELR